MAANRKRSSYRNYDRNAGVQRSNLAYDFDALENQRPMQTPKARPQIRTIRRPKVSLRPAERLSPLAVAGFLLAGVMLALVLASYVQLTVLSSSVSSLQEELGVLQTENVTLTTAYERAFDLDTVENAAHSAGMSKPTHSQVYYIDMTTPDSASVYLHEDTVMQKAIAAVGERVRMMIEYFA